LLQWSLLSNGVGAHDNVRERFSGKHSAGKNKMMMLIKNRNVLSQYTPSNTQESKGNSGLIPVNTKGSTHTVLLSILNPKDTDSATGLKPEQYIPNSVCNNVQFNYDIITAKLFPKPKKT
jgi:hypothetical protein